MITRTDKIKCDDCGRFIGFDDLGTDKATNKLFTPDSDLTREVFVSQCKKCKAEGK